MQSSTLIQQYRRSPNLLALINGICNIADRLLLEPIFEVEKQSSVQRASGVWLDRIGKRNDIERPYLAQDEMTVFGFDDNGAPFDHGGFTYGSRGNKAPAEDDFYRRLIIAKGGQLTTDGSVQSMSSVLQSAFGKGHYIDHFDMTMTVRVDGSYRTDQTNMILNTGLITKPAAVKLKELHMAHDEGAFGFDDNGAPFDQAPFSKIIKMETP